MRPFFLAGVLPLILCVGGCATQVFVDGTVSYTTTPPTAGQSGALPLRALYCSDTMDVTVRVGDGCVLTRTASATQLSPVGECRLPTAEGLVPVTVTSASENAWHHVGKYAERSPIEVVVGGTLADGRYMTYRFSEGGAEADATSADCAALRALNGRYL
jgi:hypothetical protein